jgi:hypothetical protein
MSNMTEIIDKYLQKWVELDLNKLPYKKIEKEMADPSENPLSEWKTWFPIDSKVNDLEIIDLENQIGFNLPKAYKDFLKHKHFYELQIYQASFCSHPINIWRSSLTEMTYNGCPREYFLDKGYMPFANWSDWGLLCFNTNEKVIDHSYPIMIWDHERFDEFELQSDDFEQLILNLDKETIKNAS